MGNLRGGEKVKVTAKLPNYEQTGTVAQTSANGTWVLVKFETGSEYWYSDRELKLVTR